ncbi:hypothetical protein AALO_G00226420 [Alosa alosa]|uniref:Uncharacterized protein n=1 Tax=Alosa alosa TaxID=278164 RepID=A0AAV6FYL2_9TELE|nr:hypothetical protein AALO_G00226420 [Alosa alosa]
MVTSGRPKAVLIIYTVQEDYESPFIFMPFGRAQLAEATSNKQKPTESLSRKSPPLGVVCIITLATYCCWSKNDLELTSTVL